MSQFNGAVTGAVTSKPARQSNVIKAATMPGRVEMEFIKTGPGRASDDL
jgi:hypothetical protein